MTEAEKEMFIESLKNQFRNMFPQNVADKLCKKLDEAKKGADTLELLYNQRQKSLEQLIKLL